MRTPRFTTLRTLPALLLLGGSVMAARVPAAQSSSWLEDYRGPAARLIAESLSSAIAWERLALHGDTIGHRLSGAEGHENGIQWAVTEISALRFAPRSLRRTERTPRSAEARAP